MQYLVSVITDSPGLATPDEMAAIDVFNDGLQADGHWVFAGGLGAPSTATVVDGRGREAIVHRRAVRRDQGVAHRLLGHRGP